MSENGGARGERRRFDFLLLSRARYGVLSIELPTL